MPKAKRQSERLIALFVAGLLALNFPLLSLASLMKRVWGIPLLYFYLFVVWAIIIVVSALALRDRPGPSDPSPGPRGGG